jgi:SulP family sulfate permease
MITPHDVLPSLLAGSVIGAVVVIVAISFAALVFSGPLSGHVASGTGLALFGAAIVALVTGLGSSLRSMVATPQDSTAAVVALIAAAVAARVPAEASSEQTLYTVTGAIALTTILGGAFFLALGYFRLGGLIRFIPYPVIGGFLAGTGWLLSKGALEVLAGQVLRPATMRAFLEPDVLLRWVPGALFAVTLFVALRWYRHILLLPALLLGSIVVFYAALLMTGTTVSTAGANGLLLGPFPDDSLWRPLTPSALGQIHWPSLIAELGSVAPVLVVGVVTLLLNASGLELAVHRDIHLNRELKIAGVANLLGGMGGGLPGFQTLSLSALAQRMAPSNRLVGIVIAAICATCLITGSAMLSLLPRASLGGILLFLGLSFLFEWVIDARKRLPRSDYLVVLLILVVIATIGYLESVGLGIVIAVVLFVVKYSRVDVVRHALTGATQLSNVARPRQHREVLHELGEGVLILRLQGFIFFGTANGLVSRLRRRLRNSELGPLRYLILDFRPVTGLDSSAVLSFVKMTQLAEQHDFVIVFTQSSSTVLHQLEQGGILEDEGRARAFSELDRGLEWSENQLLEGAGISLTEQSVPLESFLETIAPEPNDVAVLVPYFERLDLPAAHYLMRQGDAPDAVFYVESGRVRIQVEIDEGKTVRLLSMGPGSIIGELEMYRGRQRSASAVTESSAVIHRISAESLIHLERQDPDRASAFHRLICRLLAERLTKTINTLQALLR